jgi:hypothetical protein
MIGRRTQPFSRMLDERESVRIGEPSTVRCRMVSASHYPAPNPDYSSIVKQKASDQRLTG